MRHTAAAATAVLLTAALAAHAGPIAPPVGPIAPTMKTLQQVEPRVPIGPSTTPGDLVALYRITQPGSYYLTGNIDAPNNVAAIEVGAPNVTVDLNGFVVERTAAGASNRSLIRVAAGSERNITVRNGTVRNSGQHGVELGTGARIEDVRVVQPALGGIRASSLATVSGCTVDDPGTFGVQVDTESFVESTTVFGPGAEGIIAATDSRVSACIVKSPTSVGISVGHQAVVEGCTVANGWSWGISAIPNTMNQTIRNNTVTQNDQGGIRVYYRAQVEGNVCASLGISVPNISLQNFGNRVERNRCSGGTDAVRVQAGGFDNLVICNYSLDAGASNGFANIATNLNMLGPVVTAQGAISSTSPYANFSQ